MARKKTVQLSIRMAPAMKKKAVRGAKYRKQTLSAYIDELIEHADARDSNMRALNAIKK